MKRKKAKKRSIYKFGLFVLIIIFLFFGFYSTNFKWEINTFAFNFNKIFEIFRPQSIKFQDTDVKVYFSPNGGCRKAIITEIDNAHKSIIVAMYYFTNREIAQSIIRAKNRGVSIKILLDESQTKEKFSKYRFLIKNGIRVQIDRRTGLMHNKFAVIDDLVLITGSYNWTSSAEHKNRENLLIIKNEKLAQRYIWEFNKLWARSSP